MACNETAAEARDLMEAPQTAVVIKIKTLDSQVYTCRVEKNVSVPDLKEQVALVTGVPSGSQRLICRGKVLKDEHALSAYEVEDGHTLHLVTRPAPPPSVSAASIGAQSEEQESHDYSSYNRPGHISHSVLVGTFNFPDHRSVAFSELNRILSSLLSSLRVGSYFSPTLGAGNGNLASLQPSSNAFNGAQEREEHADQIPEQRMADQATTTIPQSGSDSIDGLLREAGYVGAMPAVSHVRIVHQVVPNALRTMSQHVDRMERIFAVRNEQAQMLSSISNSRAQSQSNAQPHLLSGEDLNPAAWGSLFRRLQELLRNQAASELLRTANQIEAEPSLQTPVARGHLLFSGIILEQLGRLLLDLGSTAFTLLTEPSQPEAVSASAADLAPHQGGEPTQYVNSDDTSGNMDIPIHAGLPLFLVAQPTQEGPSLSLNLDGTRDSTNNASEPASNGSLNAFMQPPSLRSMHAPASLSEHRVGSAGVPELFQSSSLLENTLGSRGVFYPLLARFQQLNPSLFAQQEGLSLGTTGSEEGTAVPSFLSSGQHHYPSLSVLQAVIENQVGQMVSDGEVGYAAGEQVTPSAPLHLEARDSQPEAGIGYRSSVQQGFESSTTCQDLVRPLLHVLEAWPTAPSEREQPLSDQEHPTQGMLRKADAETSLQLKCTGQTSLETEWSCALKDGSSLSNSHNSVVAPSVEDGKILGASKEGEAISEGFPSNELQLSCRIRLERESQDCCRIEDVNTTANRGTILQDFLSSLACRKEERSSSELVSSGDSQDLSLVLENVENQGFVLDCSGSKAVHVTPLPSPRPNTKQKQILEFGLDTLGASAGLESFECNAQRTDREGNRLCSLLDSHRRDDGKGLQQFFPVAHTSDGSLHMNEVENGEAVSMDSGRIIELQQLSASAALADKDAEDLKRHIADSSFEGLQAVKRQKML